MKTEKIAYAIIKDDKTYRQADGAFAWKSANEADAHNYYNEKIVKVVIKSGILVKERK